MFTYWKGYLCRYWKLGSNGHCLTPLHYMNYKQQIERYKHLRSIYYGDSENKVVLEDKEFKSMLIQLKRSIITKKYRSTINQTLFKSEFPEE